MSLSHLFRKSILQLMQCCSRYQSLEKSRQLAITCFGKVRQKQCSESCQGFSSVVKQLWRFNCSWRSQRLIQCACVLLGGHYPAPRLDSMALRWEKFCYETDFSHHTGTTTMDSSVAKDFKTRQYLATVHKRSAYMQIKTLQYPHSLAFSSAGNSTEDRWALPASLLRCSSPS